MTEQYDARLGNEVKSGPMSPEEREEFLSRPMIARVATVDPSGAPFIVPLWFHWDGEAFYVVVRDKAQFLPNVRHESRVCISVATETPPYARVTAQGRAEMIPPGTNDLWSELTQKMTMRYVGDVDAGYADRTAKYPRWVLRIVPDTLISWRGGGWHQRYTK